MTMGKPSPSAATEYASLCESERNVLTEALRRGASRRDAIKMLMAAGLGAASATSLVSVAGKALAATPVKGGSVRAASSVHGPDDTMDPASATSNVDYFRHRAHYNSLVQLSDDIVPQPELAEEFSSNADATEWTFKLRKGVEWHDGSKFTADDAVYSMNRHLGEDSISTAKSLVATISEWKKLDQHTIRAVLREPFADLGKVLGEKQFKIVKDGTTDFSNPVGTGPYRLVDFQPGVRSRHVRNDNYWREGGNFDEIEIFAITDPVARVNALLSGDVDMIVDLDPQSIGQVEANAGTEVKSTPSGAYAGMCLLANQAPGNNPDFVRGMKFLQRRERMVKTLLKGHGTVGNDHPINAAYGGDFCADLPIRPYDPDQAKHYIQKSGITSAEVTVAEVLPGVTSMCLMWQRECQKIGFDLKIKKVPTDGYWGAVWLKAPMNVTSWNMRPTATIMLDIAFAPGAPWNDSLWNNERMGELLKMAKSETDPANRRAIQCEMQTLAHNESGMIIPIHTNVLDGHSSKIHGIPNLPLGNLGGAEWPEFAWKAE